MNGSVWPIGQRVDRPREAYGQARILVVEDENLLSEDIEERLNGRQCAY